MVRLSVGRWCSSFTQRPKVDERWADGIGERGKLASDQPLQASGIHCPPATNSAKFSHQWGASPLSRGCRETCTIVSTNYIPLPRAFLLYLPTPSVVERSFFQSLLQNQATTLPSSFASPNSHHVQQDVESSNVRQRQATTFYLCNILRTCPPAA